MHVRVQLKRGARRLLRRSAHVDEKVYRSPREIALRNAADSLGVELGEDYLADLDLDSMPLGASEGGGPTRVDAFREELVTYIQGVADDRRRRRRRRVATLAGLVASVAVAVVLVSDVRRERSGDGRSASAVDQPLILPGYPGGGVGLSRGGNRVTTALSAGDGGELVHSAYIDVQGNVCASTAMVVRGITRQEGGGGCVRPAAIARAISRVPAYYVGTSSGPDYDMLRGYGRADLARIVADDPRARIQSTISAAWYPGGNAPADFAVKAFLVRIWHGRGVRFRSVMDLDGSGRNLGLTAVFANGDKKPILGFNEALHGVEPPRQIIDRIREPITYEDCIIVNPGEKLPPGKTRC